MTAGPRTLMRKVAAFVFPWPTKRERHAAIDAARREKERSRAAAGHAGAIEHQIKRMASENHFAQIIAEQILRDGR